MRPRARVAQVRTGWLHAACHRPGGAPLGAAALAALEGWETLEAAEKHSLLAHPLADGDASPTPLGSELGCASDDRKVAEVAEAIEWVD